LNTKKQKQVTLKLRSMRVPTDGPENLS